MLDKDVLGWDSWSVSQDGRISSQQLSCYGSTTVYRSLQNFVVIARLRVEDFPFSIPSVSGVRIRSSICGQSVVGKMWSPLYTEIPSFTEAHRNTESLLGWEWRP